MEPSTSQSMSQLSTAQRGLGYLTGVDQLVVKQELEMLEIFTGFETTNRYRIFNSFGQQCFYAAENSDGIQRFCWDNERPFTMSIVDNQGGEIVYIDHPYACCLSEMTVYSPRDTVIGYLNENCSCLPNIDVLGPHREPLYNLTGPVLLCSCGIRANADFEIRAVDESDPIGQISKKWSGFAKELFTKADDFGIQFPKDLDTQHKALLLAAAFLVDCKYYEHTSKFW